MTPTSELDAVNEMLDAIGEAPIASLDEGGADVQTALNRLRSETRKLQMQSWSFNSEETYTLSPDEDGEIALPANALRIDGSSEPVVERGRKLYNTEDQTFVFTDDVDVDLVIALDFDELPEHARAYATAIAVRKFHRSMQGDAQTAQEMERDEQKARAAFLEAEADVGDHNVLNSPTAQRFFRKRVRS